MSEKIVIDKNVTRKVLNILKNFKLTDNTYNDTNHLIDKLSLYDFSYNPELDYIDEADFEPWEEIELTDRDIFLNDDYSDERDNYLEMFKENHDEDAYEDIKDNINEVVQVDDFYDVNVCNQYDLRDFINDTIKMLKTHELIVEN